MNILESLKSNQELWDLFTRREEYRPQLLDRFNRFPCCLSSNKNVLEPAVSRYLVEHGLQLAYPGGKRFAVFLTHDIDKLYLSKSEMAEASYLAIKRLRVGELARALFSNKVKRLNALWSFSKIMDIEERYGARSTFFIRAPDRRNLDYCYEVEVLREDLGNIIDRGWEVGLHGGHEAYDNLDQMRLEKEKVESVAGKRIIGYRNHCLKLNIPLSWRLLDRAGFSYDSTLGYAGCVGFRNGMCHPFRPYDLNAEEFVDILEIPLVLMDVTLDYYMRLDVRGSWEIARRLIDTVEQNQGVITVLWHNTYLVDEMLELYERILEYCGKKNAWMTSGEEICHWWQARDSWEVTGGH